MGLRERKKRQTRSLISDVASGLFVQRGFDNVTVAEVAEAAGVSAKTVFNYFPRKEDLFLDRYPEAVELVTRAVRERAEGRPLSPRCAGCSSACSGTATRSAGSPPDMRSSGR